MALPFYMVKQCILLSFGELFFLNKSLWIASDVRVNKNNWSGLSVAAKMFGNGCVYILNF